MAKSLYNEISVDELRDLLDYDPENGVLIWKRRPPEMFSLPAHGKMWNTQFAGKRAGCAHTACSVTYVVIKIFATQYKAHRIAWAIHYGEWPKHEIDHIDGNGLNNRIVNLRDVIPSTNQRNRRMNLNNTTGHTGVYWVKDENKWRAMIHVYGKNKHLGLFENLQDAVFARIEAQRKHGFTERHGIPG